MTKKIATIISICLLATCAFSQDTTKILFIGNSLTYVNNLPVMFENLAVAGGKKVLVEESTAGGYTLQMHYNWASTQAKIASKDWDCVILQEQSQIPSMPGTRETLFYPWAAKLDSTIHVQHPLAQTMFFLTFAHRNGDVDILAGGGTDTYFDMQQRLREGYMHIADSLNDPVAPVGWAWRSVRTMYPLLNLYSDDVHPNINGTYIAANVFYAAIFKENSFGNTFGAGLNPDTALLIQNLASHTVLDSLNLWNIYPTVIICHPEDENDIQAWYSNGRIFVKSMKELPSDCRVNIYSSDGRLIMMNDLRNPISTNTLAFSFTIAKPGIYCCKFTGRNLSVTKKIIIN
ncbi:MAG: T9SS type A sorting domain-containing protein [Bacteroidetes bacterium]|nr:T9SS type A sorting domain-containing protein [Bacteroidota bacterium]